MAPTIVRGDFILVETFVYRSASPKRGDIIVFKYSEESDQQYVKRVIGVAGDHISIYDHQLLLNGQEQHEDYAQHQPKQSETEGEWTVPDGQFFVLGDNRDNSSDSRHRGFVKRKQVIGKVRNIW